MLRNNLSSRPFYNQRAVGAALGGAALVVLALTAFNAWQLLSLSAERRDAQNQIESSRAEVTRIRTDTAQIQQGLDTSALNALMVGTQEANGLIDRRSFSWTEFFGYIEKTLPIDVRLVAVVPRLVKGVFTVEMHVVGRTADDLEDFTRALRETKTFRDVYPKSESANDDGTLGAEIVASYSPLTDATPRTVEAAAPSAPPPAGTPPRASPPPGTGRGGQRP
ncbi:MAG TPA: hypothetical protein VFO19_07610 [Vicinamibacterales bacterium]|nr:hypothetical protein [Vicinamibacterales bacterium]